MLKTHPLHEKAKLLVKDYLELEVELLTLLQRIEAEGVFRALGYASLFQYCVSGLGLSESQAYMFIGVARKCTKVPELKVAIESGRINTQTAKRILPVLESGNCESWVKRATDVPQKILEREVAAQSPDKQMRDSLKPVSFSLSEFRCGLSHENEKLLSRVRELENQRTKGFRTWNEVMGALASEYLNRHDPMRKQLTARRVVPNEKAKAIPVAVRRLVHQRDGGRCQQKLPGGQVCGTGFWTEVHHRLPRSEGGTHRLENLVTLCRSHHSGEHRVGARPKFPSDPERWGILTQWDGDLALKIRGLIGIPIALGRGERSTLF